MRLVSSLLLAPLTVACSNTDETGPGGGANAAEMPAPASAPAATLRHGIERSGQLLHQLLDLTRAQSMHTPPASPVSAQAVFREVLETLMPLAEARHIDVGVEGTEDFWLAVDTLDIHLLLRNLLDNAIRYTPAGGRVDLSIHALDDCIALCVTDSGPGIPVDERQRVFAPFHRILGSEQPGSGLGLAIVKAIADRLGATIRLDYANEEQQTGLRVSVLLPLSLTRHAP
jgi:two-component system OmpR family sensor kinase